MRRQSGRLRRTRRLVRSLDRFPSTWRDRWPSRWDGTASVPSLLSVPPSRTGLVRVGAALLGIAVVTTVLTNAGPIALFLFPEHVVQPVTVEERRLYRGLGAEELGATPEGWSQSFEYRKDPPSLDQLRDVNDAIINGGDCEDYAAAVLGYLWGRGESATMVYYVSLDSYEAHLAIVDEGGLHYSNGDIEARTPREFADRHGYELVLTRETPPPA